MEYFRSNDKPLLTIKFLAHPDGLTISDSDKIFDPHFVFILFVVCWFGGKNHINSVYFNKSHLCTGYKKISIDIGV